MMNYNVAVGNVWLDPNGKTWVVCLVMADNMLLVNSVTCRVFTETSTFVKTDEDWGKYFEVNGWSLA